MKQTLKHAFLAIVFVAGIALHAIAQRAEIQLAITMTNGEQATYSVTEDSRISFEDNEYLLISGGESTVKMPLSDIRKIVCSETVGTPENSQTELAVYPNPVRDALTLRNLEGTASVRIFTLDGRLVKSFEITENQIVDISELPAGLYLLNVDSKTLKMMKL